MKTFRDWIPKTQATDVKEEELPGPAVQLLSMVDGRSSIDELAVRSGMDFDDMLTAFAWLVGRGAVPSEGSPPEILQLAQIHERVAARERRLARTPPPSPERVDVVSDSFENLEDLPELDPVLDAADPDALGLLEYDAFDGGGEDAGTSEVAEIDEPTAYDGFDGMDPEVPDPSESDEAQQEAAAGDVVEVSNLRKLFETVLHPLPRDARVERAHTATGDVLHALCLDPEPGVIQAVLENPTANVTHARLVAEHHRNPVGLDVLGRRVEFARDAHVRRLLLRNNQASERLLARMLAPLTLPQVFRANVGHDLTERARKAARTQLRQKFDRSTAEEKVAVILQTEGRCLPMLPGQTFDQKTTALLCRRTYQSTMLIQSLARFPASPPMLLTHLLKQQIVQRNAHLKRQIQQHKNCPKYLNR